MCVVCVGDVVSSKIEKSVVGYPWGDFLFVCISAGSWIRVDLRPCWWRRSVERYQQWETALHSSVLLRKRPRWDVPE